MINFFHIKILFCIFFIEDEVIITFLYLNKSYTLAPISSLISFKFFMFLADLFIFFNVFVSEIPAR